MSVEECKVDLTKADVYPRNDIPDADVETCLRVLRTIRGCCLDNLGAWAEAALVLSEAHKTIYDMVDSYQKELRDADGEETGPSASSPEADPSTVVDPGVRPLGGDPGR